MGLNSETGFSSWLTISSLQDQEFHLHKQEEFWDALHLHYGWKLANTPKWPLLPFTQDHARLC